MTIGLNTINVLIIEDYKLTRIGLKYFLEKAENIRVIGEADNAETGLVLFQELKPDIVLMDLGLPKMNGIEATKKIREINPEARIIVLTSHSCDNEVLTTLGSGAQGYCLKDISPELLVKVIQEVNEGAMWLDPQIARTALSIFQRQGKMFQNSKDRNLSHLTEREYEVLKLLVDGKSNTEIAEELIVSVHTAKAHVCNILQKLCVDDRVQAAVKAIKENII